MDEGRGVLWCGEGCPDMDNGNAVVKPLVTRASDDVEDNTFVKSIEEAPLLRRRAPLPQRKMPLVRSRAPVVQRRAPCCVIGRPGVV